MGTIIWGREGGRYKEPRGRVLCHRLSMFR